jgi:polyisoprenoid-binding protein YceI
MKDAEARARPKTPRVHMTNPSLRVVIDAASMDTGVGDRDEHLRPGDFSDSDHIECPQILL